MIRAVVEERYQAHCPSCGIKGPRREHMSTALLDERKHERKCPRRVG